MQKLKKEQMQKGITLIALVITIVVLLILAGVSIATLTGNNGILTRANDAKIESEETEEDELRRLTALEAATNLENKTIIDNSMGKDVTVTIPAGFAISLVEGEQTVKEGLVIIDKNGNEFVWIPVTDESTYIRNTTYESTDISSNSYDYDGYLPSTVENEKKVVTNAKGFYIARYETGKELINNEYVPVSKKGAVVWCNITQPEAQSISESFISNSNVVSALISGTQWDVTMGFVNNKDGFITTEMSANRHIGSLTVSGQNKADKVYNIYDLEGNAWEYIAEKNTYSTNSLYNRRGSYYNGNNSASYRSCCNGEESSSRSFRMVLYPIKS